MKAAELMEIPRYVAMGSRVLDKTPFICEKIGLPKAVHIVCGGTSTAKVADNVANLLSQNNFKVFKTMLNSLTITDREVKYVYGEVKESGSKLMIGVGGGRILDVAKLSSAWAQIPFISIPTSAAHDGISSPIVNFLLRNFVAQNIGENYVKAQSPIAILADTEVIRAAPYKMLAAGCGDLIAKFISYKDWRLASKLRNEDYSEYAASMALMSARLIMKHADVINKGLEESVRIVVKALIGSGVSMSIAGSSRPASGSEHLFSHALDLLSLKHGFKPAQHGEQCGVGAIMMMYLHGGNWVKIRDTLRRIGAPVNAKELGIEENYIIEALEKAHEIRPERYTILGDRGLTKDAAEKLAKETEVI